MSTFRHPRPFPFKAPALDLSAFSFVPFPSDPADPIGHEGLTAARRFLWKIKKVNFVPIGAYGAGENYSCFPDAISIPQPATPDGGFLEFNAYGAVWAGAGTEESPAVDPLNRVQWPSEGYEENGQLVVFSTFIFYAGSQPANADAEVQLLIDYSDGKWGLRYSFFFMLGGAGGEGVVILIKSPLIADPSGAGGPFTEVITGSVEILGAQLDFIGKVQTATAGNVTTSPDLNLTTEFFA